MPVVKIVLSVVLTLLSWESALATSGVLRCSIHPKKGTAHADLPRLAAVSQTDAEQTVLKSLKKSAVATVTEGELEIEHGCLVYSFDIRVSDRNGVEEVLVDAGTGKILSHAYESAKQEAVEKANEK
jgi:Peptidase propeptide and YPEB domain